MSGAMICVHMPQARLAMNQLLLDLGEEPAGFRTVSCCPQSNSCLMPGLHD